MNDELLANYLSGSASVPVTPKKEKPPFRTIATLILMALAAVGLMVLPRPTLYYPYVAAQTDGIQIEFLLNGRQGETSCQAAAASVAKIFMSSCSACRTLDQSCIKNPSQELRRRFDETPLPMPSARIADGIVTYRSTQAGNAPDLALMACRESDRQADLIGDKAKVACYPAGAARPHTPFEIHRDRTGHTIFTLLLGIVGALIASLTAAILIAYYRGHRTVVPLGSHRDSHWSSPPVIANDTRLPTEHEGTKSTSHIPIILTHPWLEKLVLAGVDTLVLLTTFLALAWPESHDLNRWSHIDRTTVLAHAGIMILTIGWFWLLLEHYGRRRPFWDELSEIIRVLAIMFMVSASGAFIAGLEIGRVSHHIVWVLNFLLIPSGRAGARMLLDDLGLWQQPAVIIGTGENARDAYLAIKSERGMGYHILGFVNVDRQSEKASGNAEIHIDLQAFPVFDGTRSLESILIGLGNPRIILALDNLIDSKNQALTQRLLATHTNIHIIPSIRGLPLFGTQLSHFFSHEVLFLTVRNNLSRRGYIWIKRIFDLVTATLLLILLTPLFLVLSYLIRRSGGTAFYSHPRVGRNGKSFKCLKFRSMRPDADKVLKTLLNSDPVARAEWDKDFKLKNDPRITPVGHFLRKTSLDELPQLINVIKGEMSLVGPRPIVTAELERYGDYKNLYLQILPGITGLWQVSGRNDTSYAERVSLDSWYVQNWSLWYDIAILFKTMNVVLKRRGAY